MIKVKNLSKSYGSLQAVLDVSFEIQAGEIVGLLGHNGAGKTTIMKMLTGYIEPDQGQIEIAGYNLQDHLLKIQKNLGYLPENCPSYGELTVSEYLEFSAELKGIENVREKVLNAIIKVGLRDRLTQKIQTLSKGYQQRVGVAQAILSEPAILIMDEPTNGLDPRQIREMRLLIKELSKSSTIILSTHILQEVEAICDRVLVMMGGKLVLDSNLSAISNLNNIVLESDQGELKDALLALPGVSAVKLTSQSNNFIYQLESKQRSTDLVDQVVRAVINTGAKVYSVYQRTESLDSVFKNLESRE